MISTPSIQSDKHLMGQEAKEEGRNQGPGTLLSPFRYLQRELDSGAPSFPPLHGHILLLRYSMWTQVWRPHVQSKIPAFMEDGLCLRQVQNNPKMTSNKALSHLCMAEHKGIHLVLLWQSRSFPGETCGHLKRETNSRLLLLSKQGLLCIRRPQSL